jgi:hypothetical protein
MKIYKPEVIITPRVGHIGIMEDININELIQEGINATEKTLTKIESEANWMKKIQRRVKNRILPDECPEIWGNID